MLKCVIPLDPVVFLLNIFPKALSKEMKHIIININTAARLLYTQM